MRFRYRQSDSIDDTVDSLYDRAPLVQLAAGAVLFLAGAFGTVVLYQSGITWDLTIVAAAAGGLLLCNGFAALRHVRELQAQVRLVRDHGEEIIQELIKLKSAGGNVVAFLRGKGITDIRFRQALLRRAEKRMTGSKPG